MGILSCDRSVLDQIGMAPLDAEPQDQTVLLPDLLRLLAYSPAALSGYLALRASLQQGELPAPLREQIAIAVAAANDCRACLTNHVRFGREAGLSEEVLHDAACAHADDPGADAALRFSRALVESRGHVDNVALEELRVAGFSDGAIIEIVAVVALNVFANFVNSLFACAVPVSVNVLP